MWTAGSPAEAGGDAVARAFGGLVLRGERPGAASRDDTGQRFVFVPQAGGGPSAGEEHALDVERRALPAPPALARLLGLRAMARWGEVEVIAKLTGVPAHLVLRQVLSDGIAAIAARNGIDIRRCDTDLHLIVVGRRRRQEPVARDG